MKNRFGTRIYILVLVAIVPLIGLGGTMFASLRHITGHMERVNQSAEIVKQASTDIGITCGLLRELSLSIVLASDDVIRQEVNTQQVALTADIFQTLRRISDRETATDTAGKFAAMQAAWDGYLTLKDFTVERSLAGYREEAFINVMNAEKKQYQDFLDARIAWTDEKVHGARRDYDAAKAFLSLLLRWALVLTVVIVVSIAVFGIWIGRSVIRPVEALKDAASRIQQKQPVGSILPGRTDELGELAQVIEGMAHGIQTYTEELERKNEELDQFSYTVSHDLKSPLVTIQGFLGFAEESAMAGHLDKMREDMSRIRGAADKMRHLLSELLEMSRAGRKMNVPEVLSAGAIIRDAVDNLAGQIQAKGAVVRVNEDLPSLYGDRVKLLQLFQNLIDNAIKYSGVQVRPEVEVGFDGNKYYVKDNGIGIDSQYHDKIFQIFYKLNPASEGSGIGMALVKRIVETHGGRIWVESQGQGKGTTVYFTIGLKNEKENAPTP